MTSPAKDTKNQIEDEEWSKDDETYEVNPGIPPPHWIVDLSRFKVHFKLPLLMSGWSWVRSEGDLSVN